MQPCQYVRTTHDLDYSPHAVVKKGEIGRIASLTNGQPRVMWERIHAGFADWNNTTLITKEDAAALEVIRAPVLLTVGRQAALFAAIVLGIGGAVVMPGFTVRWTGNEARALEGLYLAHGPRFVERVIETPTETLLITYEHERNPGSFAKVISRRILETPEEIKRELARLNRQ